MKKTSITVGVPIMREHVVKPFFRSCLKNGAPRSKGLNFVIIDNACEFDLETEVKKHIEDSPYKIIKNDCVESLAYNQNLIYFNSDTNYTIYSGEEVIFLDNWLDSALIWILKNDKNKFAHLARGVKGCYNELIPKLNYFNFLLTGKDGTDDDIEYREACHLADEQDMQSIDVDPHELGENFLHKVIGDKWRQEHQANEYYSGLVWASTLCWQPEYEKNGGDSNAWLFGEESNKNLSPRNSNRTDIWDLIGKQDEDLVREFKQKYNK